MHIRLIFNGIFCLLQQNGERVHMLLLQWKIRFIQKVFEMIFVSWIDTGCETKNKQNKENVILCPRMAFWMHVGNETVIVPNITMFLHYVSQWGGWICLWINRIFHCNKRAMSYYVYHIQCQSAVLYQLYQTLLLV
jgi:hypothetical protein